MGLVKSSRMGKYPASPVGALQSLGCSHGRRTSRTLKVPAAALSYQRTSSSLLHTALMSKSFFTGYAELRGHNCYLEVIHGMPISNWQTVVWWNCFSPVVLRSLLQAIPVLKRLNFALPGVQSRNQYSCSLLYFLPLQRVHMMRTIYSLPQPEIEQKWNYQTI